MTTTTPEESTLTMKDLERQYRTVLPAKSYAVIRVDGKGFSKYTRNLQRPFDPKFTEDMTATALYLCEHVDGAQFAYTQSDEISVIISDLTGANTQAWFGGQVQKIVSTSAALATAKFNRLRPEVDALALFDGPPTTWTAPKASWNTSAGGRADAMKNSVGMLASHHFGHRALTGVSVRERKNMLAADGISWDDLDPTVKQGTFVRRVLTERTVCHLHTKEQVMKTLDVQRREWTPVAAPYFDTVESFGLVRLGRSAAGLARGEAIYSGFSLESAMIQSGVTSPVSLSKVIRALAAAI